MKKLIALVTAGLLAVILFTPLTAQVIPQPGPPMPIGCAYNVTPVTLSDAQAGWAQCDSSGNLKTTASFSGSLTIVTPLSVSQGETPWVVTMSSGVQPVSLRADTTGGCTPAKTLSAASTNSTNVKTTAGTLCSVNVINATPTVYYLKFYNTVTTPTCNSDTVVQSYPVPANSSSLGGGIAVQLGPYGLAFSTGIGLCLTGAVADNDNTSAAAGIAINYGFK